MPFRNQVIPLPAAFPAVLELMLVTAVTCSFILLKSVTKEAPKDDSDPCWPTEWLRVKAGNYP